ncbi:MAG: DNA-3-methyladenine glycosylase [Vulcanimicrobiaceae bacterium]
MVKSSVFRVELPVVAPFRLDVTADALRRLSTNVVDRYSEAGEYLRAIQDHEGIGLMRVRQASKNSLAVCIEGRGGERFLPTIVRMLGTDVDLSSWYRHIKAVPWLNAFAKDVRGVKPPRYPSLWEALCHAIIFQQISIHAAGAIMQRMIEGFGTPLDVDGAPLYPFPQPEAIADARVDGLRAAGLSVNKVAALHHVARAILDGIVDERSIEDLSIEQISARLCTLRGIGPWSAAVVMLRGLGRLDVFPMNDSGVAASLRLLSGNRETNIEQLLVELGDQRGMLYFHLLLGRIAQKRAAGQATGATRPGL